MLTISNRGGWCHKYLCLSLALLCFLCAVILVRSAFKKHEYGEKPSKQLPQSSQRTLPKIGEDPSSTNALPIDLPSNFKSDILANLIEDKIDSVSLETKIQFEAENLRSRNPETASDYDLLLSELRLHPDSEVLFKFLRVVLSICDPLLPEYPGGDPKSDERPVIGDN